MKYLLLTVFAIALGSPAWAHSKLNTTVPENGATLATAPERISMTFGKKIRLVKVELTHQDEQSYPLDLGTQTRFATEFELPISDVGAGQYHIEWRGLSADGHAMSGQFLFTVE